MTTEFNLSKKRYSSFDGSDMDGEKYSYHYQEEDVKEFIRLLKEKIDKSGFIYEDLFDTIDTLAGEKLT